ncbi:hypothetical protein NJ7G_3729 [Natrinema sp. J7-2]|nr:hypothetical protein NJ7G_3729 [Natrinema sp. J7-2]
MQSSGCGSHYASVVGGEARPTRLARSASRRPSPDSSPSLDRFGTDTDVDHSLVVDRGLEAE